MMFWLGKKAGMTHALRKELQKKDINKYCNLPW